MDVSICYVCCNAALKLNNRGAIITKKKEYLDMEKYISALMEACQTARVKAQGNVYSIRAAVVDDEIVSGVFIGDDYLDVFSIVSIDRGDLDNDSIYIKSCELLKLREEEVKAMLR